MMKRIKPSRQEIADRRNEAERILSSRNFKLNRNLIRVIGLDRPTGVDALSLTDELVDTLSHFARLREADDRKPFKAWMYFSNLYVEPFRGVETENVANHRRALVVRDRREGLLERTCRVLKVSPKGVGLLSDNDEPEPLADEHKVVALVVAKYSPVSK